MRTMNTLFNDFDKLFKEFDGMWEDSKSTRKEVNYVDGVYEVDVPGFCQDDLDVTIDDRRLTFAFENDRRKEMFSFKIPRSTENISVKVKNGVLMFSLQHKPSNVSISFEEPKALIEDKTVEIKEDP